MGVERSPETQNGERLINSIYHTIHEQTKYPHSRALNVIYECVYHLHECWSEPCCLYCWVMFGLGWPIQAFAEIAINRELYETDGPRPIVARCPIRFRIVIRLRI